jgi:hypothetical protein
MIGLGVLTNGKLTDNEISYVFHALELVIRSRVSTNFAFPA